MVPANPFVYGEIVPPDAFLDREPERAQLAQDLLDGQKVFLVAPRRYGKSSLIAVVLQDLEADPPGISGGVRRGVSEACRPRYQAP